MKKFLLLFGVALLASFLFHSCRKSDKLLKTTFSGRLYDVARNKPVPGYPIVVSRVWVCSRGLFANRTCDEIAGSVVTDANGYFTMEFDALPDGDYYYQQQYRPPYKEEIISSSGKIRPGVVNTLQLDVWYPVVWKINLNVLNNQHPGLSINSNSKGDYLWNEMIYELNVTKTLYFKARPNAINSINSYYSISPQANFSHTKIDSFNIGLQDTVNLNYTVDCNTF